jgi:iron complex transport system ATP-binding protein
MEESVRIDHVCFAYGEHLILKDVSLAVGKGEVVSVIGPNGAGKSTLVAIAIGHHRPHGGTVRVAGRLLSGWSPREFAKYCAFVPQNASIPPGFTVWESVFLGRTPYLGFLGIAGKEDRRIVEHVIADLEIGELKDRKIGEISGGERQRVILARALAQEPRCLFLDEPTNFLDVHHQVMLLSFLSSLARERGVAVFIVLHDLNIASTFSDRIILLANGEVVVQGTPSKVMADPRIVSLYENSITIIERPDDDSRPAVLPVRIAKK